MRFLLALALSHLTIWYYVPFFLAKAAMAYLLTVFFVALRPVSSLCHAQYAQVFSLKLSPFYKLFSGLGSTNKSATTFLIPSYRRLVLSFVFPFTSISPAGTVLFLFLYYQATMGPRTLVFRETTQLMSWSNRKGYSCSLQSLVVYLLLSLVCTL